ncbi:hypothetical protein N8Z26_05550 [Burkholderiales bacterium]|nr:hypothetical protein [Burkholderiales bacterium]
MEKLVCFFLNIGDVLDLRFETGESKRYQVIETDVVPINEVKSGFNADRERVTLVTKFPFDSQNPTERMLYVVVARRVSNSLGFVRSLKEFSETNPSSSKEIGEQS